MIEAMGRVTGRWRGGCGCRRCRRTGAGVKDAIGLGPSVQQAVVHLVSRQRYAVPGQHADRLRIWATLQLLIPMARTFPALTARAMARIQVPTPRGE
jgi:hypothetical protein